MQCPGQDNRYWGGSEVFESRCPHCGNDIEFFKDDSQRNCSNCGRKVLNPKIDFGCASYCQHAEQCLGSMPPEILAQQDNMFKNRLNLEVKKQMADDEADYRLVSKRAEFAETICRSEEGSMPVLLTATLLSKVDDPSNILIKMKAKKSLVEEVVYLLNQKDYRSNDLKKSQAIFHDACLLADIETEKNYDLDALITTTGKILAQKMLNLEKN